MMKHRWIAVGLLAAVAAAQADVQVNFVHPDKFSDIRDNNGFRNEQALTELKAYMAKAATQLLPERDIRFDVTDVNLAGEVEPWHHGQWLRVMRATTPPSMTLRYEVREDDKVVQQGEATLRDITYQDRGTLPFFSSDPLRYEKGMLDRWMKGEFSPKLAAGDR